MVTPVLESLAQRRLGLTWRSSTTSSIVLTLEIGMVASLKRSINF